MIEPAAEPAHIEPFPFPKDVLSGTQRVLDYYDRRFDQMSEDICTCTEEQAAMLSREFDELMILRRGVMDMVLHLLIMASHRNGTRH